MEESVTIGDMVLEASFNSEKQITYLQDAGNNELITLMDFQTTSIREEQGNIVIEDTVEHTEMRVEINEAQIDEINEEEGDDEDKDKDEDEDNNKADSDDEEVSGNNTKANDENEPEQDVEEQNQPNTIELNEGEIFENYSSIPTASLFETSKDNAADNAKETSDETHLTQEVASEDVPKSGQHDEVNTEQNNETDSSPLHESPIKLGSQLTNDANYISNESYTIIESQRAKTKERMPATKSTKKNSKSTNSKISIEKKSKSKSRANTRSTKQSSASTYIDNLKDNSSLRSNSHDDDFNELELINSSVPYQPQKNEKLKSRFANVIVTETIVKTTEIRFYDIINQHGVVVSRNKISSKTTEELRNRNTEEVIEDAKELATDKNDDENMKESPGLKKIGRPSSATKKSPKTDSAKRGRPSAKAPRGRPSIAKLKKPDADRETDALIVQESEENDTDVDKIVYSIVGKESETVTFNNNDNIEDSEAFEIPKSPIVLNSEHIILDDFNVESEVVICTEENAEENRKLNDEELLRKFNIKPCSVIVTRAVVDSSVSPSKYKKVKRNIRRTSDIENIEVNRQSTNSNFHLRLDNDDMVLQQSDSINGIETVFPREPHIFLQNDFVFAKQSTQNGYYPAEIVSHVRDQIYSIRFLSSNGCKIVEKNSSELISLKDLTKDTVFKYLDERNDLINVKFSRCIQRSVYVVKPDGRTIKAQFNNLLMPEEFDNNEVFETMRKRSPTKRKCDAFGSTPSKRGRKPKSQNFFDVIN